MIDIEDDIPTIVQVSHKKRQHCFVHWDSTPAPSFYICTMEPKKTKRHHIVPNTPKCLLVPPTLFFGCPTGGTFKGSLNGSKLVFRTILKPF